MPRGINSPLPVSLQNETRKAANILRSFVDKKQNGLDKVIPRSVMQKAVGFAIFTVIKAGFMFSARAGSGIVIAKLDDGTWSPPSAIGLGGFGFGGQGGAEVTDFLVVLNSRSAVASFMSAGSLTLGGNLSVAIGPFGRNAEGSGSLNTNGRLAAMYSYSKTRGLFGGVSVEGSVIVARPDANRLAYGGNPTVKQILSGSFDWPPWASVLVDQLDTCTGTGTRREWGTQDEDGEGGAMGYGSPTQRDRRGSENGGYVFGEGIGGSGSAPPGRKRATSLFGNGEKGENVKKKDDKEKPSTRPGNETRRSSALNPFSSSSSPRKPALPSSSSETYNAGLTWDSDGPMSGYGNRSRSGSSAQKPTNGDTTRQFAVPFESDYDELPRQRADNDEDDLMRFDAANRNKRNGDGGEADGANDLLSAWGGEQNGLSTSFSRMNVTSKTNGTRSRSDSRPQPFQDISEDDGSPFETKPLTNGDRGSPNKLAKSRTNGNKDRPLSSTGATNGFGSPFSDDTSQLPSNHSTDSPCHRRISNGPKPNIPLKAGLGSTSDGYARALAQFDFQATDAGDLGMKQGQVVIVLDKVGNGDWWKGRNADGKEGIFPSNYVEVLDIPSTLNGGLGRRELKARMAKLPFE